MEAAAALLVVGPAEDGATSVGPLIDPESVVPASLATSRSASVTGASCSAARLVLRQNAAISRRRSSSRTFLPSPHSRRRRCSVLCLPCFGRGTSIARRLELANGTSYALTGGIYSRSPAHIARARAELDVGNLYVNRKITGAQVARQPFGGHRQSGTGGKAGGRDYLLHFAVAKTITENTLRRGFAPTSE